MTRVHPMAPFGVDNEATELHHSFDTPINNMRNVPLRVLRDSVEVKENNNNNNLVPHSSFLNDDYTSQHDFQSGSNLHVSGRNEESGNKKSSGVKKKYSMKHHSTHDSSNLNISIKTCLIALIAFLEILTVLTLSSIWISCFLPSMLKWGTSVREKSFDNIVQFTRSTLKELILVTETERELLSDNFDPYNTELVEKHMYRLFKNELVRHPSLPVTLYLGDHTRYNYGVMQMDEDTLAAFNIDSYYYCQDYVNNDLCVRNSTPDEVLGEFDMTPILEAASQAPGGSRFTVSYADISMPSITFITLLSMVKNSTDPSDFVFWIGYDVSVQSFSIYLNSATKDTPGAIAFTIEVSTDYLISNYNPDISVASWDENEEETRMTARTVADNGTNLIAEHVYGLYPNLTDITCNQKILVEVDGYYVSIFRLCTNENIDWLIVFAEPTMNFMEAIIVAVGAALGSSLVIIILSIAFGVYIAFKIIQPFYDLIFNFSEVSEMKLEGLTFEKSVFREVQILQGHFKGMVEKIKLYRCFIPSHLISKIDGDGEDTEKSRKSKESQSKNGNSFERKIEPSDSFTSIVSIKKPQVDTMARFALHLESRRVTFTCLHIEGMGRCISTCSYTEIVNILSEIFKYVYDMSKLSGGSVGNFESETVLISFNSNIETNAAEKKAIVFASQTVKKLNSLSGLKKAISGKSSEKPVGFRAAVLSQYCCCGNLGTNEFKNFTIVGSFKQNLVLMIELALRLNIELVVTEDIRIKTNIFFQHRFIDTLQFLAETQYGLPELDRSIFKNWAFSQVVEYGNLNISMETANNSFLKQNTDVNIYEYGEFLEIKDDEWMYELEEKKKRNEWQSYINATNLFFEKRYDESTALLNEFFERSVESGKSDLPSINLLEKIKKQMEKEQENNN